MDFPPPSYLESIKQAPNEYSRDDCPASNRGAEKLSWTLSSELLPAQGKKPELIDRPENEDQKIQRRNYHKVWYAYMLSTQQGILKRERMRLVLKLNRVILGKTHSTRQEKTLLRNNVYHQELLAMAEIGEDSCPVHEDVVCYCVLLGGKDQVYNVKSSSLELVYAIPRGTSREKILDARDGGICPEHHGNHCYCVLSRWCGNKTVVRNIKPGH